MVMLRWTGTVLVLVGILLTSLNALFPLNLWAGFISCALWGIVAFRIKDVALLTIEVVAGLLYLVGVAKYYSGWGA